MNTLQRAKEFLSSKGILRSWQYYETTANSVAEFADQLIAEKDARSWDREVYYKLGFYRDRMSAEKVASIQDAIECVKKFIEEDFDVS